MVSVVGGIVERRLILPPISRYIGIPQEEAKQIIEITSWDFALEMTLEFLGDSIPLFGWITELAEIGLDINICYLIWLQYHGNKGILEFFNFVRKNPPKDFLKAVASYSFISLAKVPFKTVTVPVIGHALGFALNSAQSIAVALYWARYCSQGGKFEPVNRSDIKTFLF
jgi:hypothetical protein